MAFEYFGAKKRLAHTYQPPFYPHVIEPFAGAAHYTIRWKPPQSTIFDIDPEVVAFWRWLQTTPYNKIASLPPCEGNQLWPIATDHPAIFFYRNLAGSQGNTNTAGQFQSNNFVPALRYLLANLDYIRTINVIHDDYRNAHNVEATWFVDPPYQHQGTRYTYGATGIEYSHLGEWCQNLRGQVIVCEQEPANWLPFTPHRTNQNQANIHVVELVWYNQPQDLFA